MEALHTIDNRGYITNFHPLPEIKRDSYQKPFAGISKKSFLVFNGNKYVTVPTESIAFFYVRYEASVIVTFNKQEYPVSYSLEQIEKLLSEEQFYRLNRQYLVNFYAVMGVEHYFARKLLVVPTIAINDKLIVSKQKARSILDWLENR